MKIGSTEITSIKIGNTPITKVYRGGVLYYQTGTGTPSSSDVLFWLDGTIIDVAGTKYFQDQSSNARNFLITSYDFDSTWTTGFPYKSASTISAPAGDTALISADINNYLYDSGGTPNQIPVISLFQDIDYEHRLFCRHGAQVLDGNGVETYEPRVLDIVFYSSAKAGTNLTSCQTYFGVPEESGTAKWVSKTGNDTTGNGSKALPYLTIEKAYKTVASGSTIYVKTGIYTEEYNGTTIRYFYADRTGTWTITGLGRTEMRTISTTYVLRIVGGTTIWNRILLNGESNTSEIVNYFTATNTAQFIDCKLYAGTSYNIRTTVNAAVNTCSIERCILLSGVSIVLDDGGSITNSFCRSYVSSNGTTFVFNYNKVIFTSYLSTILTNSSTCKYNYFQVKGGILNNALLTAFEFKYNTVNFVWTVDVGANIYLVTNSVDACIPTITNNTFNSTSTAISRYVTYIRLANGTTPVIENNIFISTSKTNHQHIDIPPSVAGQGKCKVNYNVSISNAQAGIVITIGGETASVNKLDESEFIGNYLIGSLLNYPNETSSNHHVLMSGGRDFDIRFNRITYSSLGLVVKTGGTAQSYTKNGIGYNVFYNNNNSLWIRGVHDLNIWGMSVVANSGFADVTNQIKIDENGVFPGNYSENVLIYNSIIKSVIDCVYMDAHAEANGCKFYNTIFDNSDVNNKLINNYSSISATNTAGLTTDCLDTDPLYNNAITGILTVQELSPAIGIGTDLGATYDDGLDATTDWGSDTELPVVVTKQQGASWDVGAYVH